MPVRFYIRSSCQKPKTSRHPHRRDNQIYNAPNCFTRWYLQNGRADCLEICNVVSTEPYQRLYTTQAALCYDLALKGVEVPITGGGDIHTFLEDDVFKCCKTIVFALGNTRKSIIEAVRGRWTVAVEEFAGEHIHMYLSERLVNYALFLHDWLFPLFQPLYANEGKLMCNYLDGDREAGAALSALNGSIAILREKYFADQSS